MSCSFGHKYVSENGNGDTLGNSWPPRFTYLLLSSGSETVAFADPRKFGSCHFGNSLEEYFDALAPDGWMETRTLQQRNLIEAKLANQRLGIKALLLDQKRAVSGVGNWIADEVLYQCEIHPDQTHLTQEQAVTVIQTLHSILETAVECLAQDIPYPQTWLFGYRWTKKRAGKDCQGRNLTFLTSGGRTSAIVASVQKLRKSQGKGKTGAKAEAANNKKNRNDPKRTDNARATRSTVKEEDDEEDSSTNQVQDGDAAASKQRRRSVQVKKEQTSTTVKRQKQQSSTTTRSVAPVTPDVMPSAPAKRKSKRRGMRGTKQQRQ